MIGGSGVQSPIGDFCYVHIRRFIALKTPKSPASGEFGLKIEIVKNGFGQLIGDQPSLEVLFFLRGHFLWVDSLAKARLVKELTLILIKMAWKDKFKNDKLSNKQRMVGKMNRGCVVIYVFSTLTTNLMKIQHFKIFSFSRKSSTRANSKF